LHAQAIRVDHARVRIADRSSTRAAWLLTASLACNGPASGETTGEPATATTDVDPQTTTSEPSPTSSSGPSATDATTSTSSTSAPDVTTTTASDTSTGAVTGATETDASTTEPAIGTTSETTGTTTASGTETTLGDDTTGASTSDTGDTGTTDPIDELGVLAGDCGLIDAMELTSPDPFVFTGAIDFGMIGYDYDLLTPGGQQIYDEGNLNPSSLYSEIVAYEVLARCEEALLLKTEATIVYQDPMGKKTDLLVEMDGLKIGVSVVRAVGFPQDDPWTPAQAEVILQKKLEDILVSSANVAPEDAWVKQILSVVAYGPMHLDSLLTAYAGLDPTIKADTLLVITVTHGDDAFIY